MSKSNALETAFLELLFKNNAFANVGDASGLQPSAADGNLYVSMHTADPGETGTQATSETAYEDYARVAVARDGSAWVVTGNSVSPAADVTFPIAGAASPGGPLTHFGIGTAASGAGVLLYKGALTPNITMAENVTPKLLAGTTITED